MMYWYYYGIFDDIIVSKLINLSIYLVLNFQSLTIKVEQFIHFQLRNNINILNLINVLNIWTLNAYKKNHDYVLLIFFNCCYNNLKTLYYIFKIFLPNKKNIIDIHRKKHKTRWTLKTFINFSKRVKTFKKLYGIPIYRKCLHKFHVYTVIFLELHQRSKSILSKMVLRENLRFPSFFFVFPDAFKNYCEF